jgi:hypothetical protein
MGTLWHSPQIRGKTSFLTTCLCPCRTCWMEIRAMAYFLLANSVGNGQRTEQL